MATVLDDILKLIFPQFETGAVDAQGRPNAPEHLPAGTGPSGGPNAPRQPNPDVKGLDLFPPRRESKQGVITPKARTEAELERARKIGEVRQQKRDGTAPTGPGPGINLPEPLPSLGPVEGDPLKREDADDIDNEVRMSQDLENLVKTAVSGDPHAQAAVMAAAQKEPGAIGAIVNPPPDRITTWEQFFNDPEVQTAFTAFGISMLQGERGTFANIGESLGNAGDAVQATRDRATLKEERARKAGIEDRETVVKERGAGSKERQALAAEIGARATLQRLKNALAKDGREFNQKAVLQAQDNVAKRVLQADKDIIIGRKGLSRTEIDKLVFNEYLSIIRTAAGIRPKGAAQGPGPATVKTATTGTVTSDPSSVIASLTAVGKESISDEQKRAKRAKIVNDLTPASLRQLKAFRDAR